MLSIQKTSGLDYKTITIVIMMIISDATIWSVTFDDALRLRIVNYDRNCSFMVLDTVITIVNYDRHMFIVQATVS